jgi:hypothetical protein
VYRNGEYALYVLWILSLCNVRPNISHLGLSLLSVIKTNLYVLNRRVRYFCDHRCNRDHTHGKKIPSNQMVDKAAFAGFEPAKNRHCEMRAIRGSAATFEEWVDRGDLIPVRKRGDEVNDTLMRTEGPIQSILLQHVCRKK